MRNIVTPMDYQSCLVAMGSNQEWMGVNPADILGWALKRIRRSEFFITKVSRFYKTPCFPSGAGPDYVNACIMIRTNHSPYDTLSALHAIEAEAGRERIQRWGMRTLDLDLLSYGEEVLPDHEAYAHWRDLDVVDQVQAAPDRLILPHPRIQDRAFVLGPLCDIVPEWEHPVSGKTVREMFQGLPAELRTEIQPL